MERQEKNEAHLGHQLLLITRVSFPKHLPAKMPHLPWSSGYPLKRALQRGKNKPMEIVAMDGPKYGISCNHSVQQVC